MSKRLLGAVQFLTVLPLPGATAAAGEAAIFFPFVGAMLGALGGAVFVLLAKPFGPTLAAYMTVALLIASTGALHEDGLADVADAFRAGRSRERIMTILKDSRIGTYGAIALVLSVAVRAEALARCQTNVAGGTAAALALSRSVLVVTAAVTPPAGEGLGRMFSSSLSRSALAVVIVEAVILAVALDRLRGTAMLIAATTVITVARSFFGSRLGGVNGDCLGATCQLAEALNFLLLAWQPSI